MDVPTERVRAAAIVVLLGLAAILYTAALETGSAVPIVRAEEAPARDSIYSTTEVVHPNSGMHDQAADNPGASDPAASDPAASDPAASDPAASDPAADMVDAANAFLATLGEAGSAPDAVFVFEADERFNWHFVPRERLGLSIERMTAEQRSAAHRLLRSALSSQGYLKATQIMFLETILRQIEEQGPRRDPENYFLSIFGTPSESEPWGWRFEGHHLSLNYTSAAGGLSVTPAFLGANPEEVTVGFATGLRVLAREEDLARTLVLSLTEAQRSRAIISDTAPDDILTGNDRRPRLGEPEGLPASAMTPPQAAALRRVIEEYVHNMTDEIALEQMTRIEAAGFDELHFAWAGSLRPDEPHYYRIQGPTVIFEYDNTQNDARHPHSVWRDIANDFGEDLLKKHYEESHRH